MSLAAPGDEAIRRRPASPIAACRRCEPRALPVNRERNGVRFRGSAAGQPKPPIAYVAPGLELEADVVVDANFLESHSFMKADASRVGQDNLRERRSESLPPQDIPKRPVQSCSDAGTAVRPIDVDRRVDGPTIGWPLTMPAGVGVADDLPFAVRGDQPWIHFKGTGDAPRHDIRIRRVDLEGHCRVAHIGRIDFRHGRSIIRRSRSHLKPDHAWPRPHFVNADSLRSV